MVNAKYHKRKSLVIGIVQLIIGLLCLIIYSIILAVHIMFGFIGVGIVCGALYIITGSIGIAATLKKPTLIRTFLILCILSLFSTIVLGIQSIHHAAAARSELSRMDCQPGWPFSPSLPCMKPESLNTFVALNAVMVVLAVCQAGFSLWGLINVRASGVRSPTGTNNQMIRYSHSGGVIIPCQSTMQYSSTNDDAGTSFQTSVSQLDPPPYYQFNPTDTTMISYPTDTGMTCYPTDTGMTCYPTDTGMTSNSTDTGMTS